MALVTCGYGPVLFNLNEGLWGIPMSVLYHSPRGFHPALHNGISFFDGY